MIKIGDTVRFIPTINYGAHKSNKAVTARVIYINWPHRFLTLEYEINNFWRCDKYRESFKFAIDVPVDHRYDSAEYPRQIQSKHGNITIY